MVIVKKKKGESEDRLISRFRKMILNEGIIIEARDRTHYKKPSERKKEKKYRLKHLQELEKNRNK